MTLHRIEVRLAARTDLLFPSSRRRDNVLDTLDHVPGTALRGAVASAWLARGRDLDDTFRRLFQSGTVRFTDARATIDGEPAFPAPFTLQASKYGGPGELVRDEARRAPDEMPPVRISRCRRDVTATGHLRATTSVPTVVRTRIGTFDDPGGDTANPSSESRSRQGLTRTGQLFTEVRLPGGTEFAGGIVGPADDLEQLAGLLGELDSLSVGRSRSVAGWVTATWSPPAPVPPPLLANGPVHTLTLRSDAVLLDDRHRGIGDIDASVLAALLPDVDASDLEVLPTSDVRPTVVGGWDSINRMPHPQDQALAAGSVVVFRGTDASADQRLRQALQTFAADPWIGFGKATGRGWLAVDATVHDLATTFTVAEQRTAAPATAPDRRGWIAELARDVADTLARSAPGRTHVTTAMWSAVQQVVRSGQPPAAPAEPSGPEHQQSRSERAAGRGRQPIAARRICWLAVTGVRDGTLEGDLGTQAASRSRDLGHLDGPELLAFVEDVGRELALHEVQIRQRQHRQRELGVHHRAGSLR